MREQETIRVLVDMLSTSQEELRELREQEKLWAAEKAALRTTGIQVHSEDYVAGLQKDLDEAGDAVCERDERIQAAEDALTKAGVLAEHGNLVDRIEALVDLERTWNGRVKDAERTVDELKQQVAGLKGARDDWRDRAQKAGGKVSDLESELCRATEARDQARQSHVELLKEYNGKEEERALAVQARDQAQRRLHALVQERDTLKEQLEWAEVAADTGGDDGARVRDGKEDG